MFEFDFVLSRLISFLNISGRMII